MSVTEKILEVLQSAIEFVHQGILLQLYINIRIIFTAISDFILNIFSDFGSSIVSFGDLVASSFQSNGFASLNNFFYAFIGIIFFVFCIKTGIKLVLKVIEIIGNFIPFT